MRFRQIHLDFHTSPLIPGIGKAFNKKEWQETLKKANVDSITLFAYGHHGNAYFSAKESPRHPHLDFELLRAQMDACHEIGVATPVYISAGLFENYVEKHPDWLEHRFGQKFSKHYAGFKKFCFGSPWLDKLCEITREVVTRFPDADGIFFDIINQGPCVCKHCTKRMKAQGLDPKCKDDVEKFAHQVLMEYYQRTTEAVHSIAPKMRVFHNSGNVAVGTEEILPYFTHLELESLPTGGWGYDHFTMSAAFVRNLGLDFLGMTGKFATTWGEFGGFKHPNALRYECAAMIANGAKCSIGDQLHPSGKLDFSTYCEVIAPAYRDVREKEAWCDGVTSKTPLAILSYAPGFGPTAAVREASTGAARILAESHIPYDIVDQHLPWDKYDYLIVPDNVLLDTKLLKQLNAFRKRGGKLILSADAGRQLLPDGKPGPFALKKLGFQFKGETEWTPDYLQADAKFAPSFVHTPMVMYYGARKIKATSGVQSLGDLYAPYFNRNADHFCSHAQTPYQPKPSGFSAGVMTDDVLYFAHPVFSAYNALGAVALLHFVQKALFAFLGADNPVVAKGLSSIGRVTYMRQEAQKRDVVHLLYAPTAQRGIAKLPDAPFFTCHGTELIEDLPSTGCPTQVSVKRAKRPSAVKLAPSGEALPFKYAKGRVEFTVPAFSCHQMVELDD